MKDARGNQVLSERPGPMFTSTILFFRKDRHFLKINITTPAFLLYLLVILWSSDFVNGGNKIIWNGLETNAIKTIPNEISKLMQSKVSQTLIPRCANIFPSNILVITSAGISNVNYKLMFESWWVGGDRGEEWEWSTPFSGVFKYSLIKKLLLP